jgi:hypothetical protein
VTLLASASRGERLLLALTPAAAMAAVALGLRLGAPESVRAALVDGAEPAAARRGLAWTVAVFDETGGGREPAAGAPVDVVARAPAGASTPWHGVTNGDGVVEAWIDRAPAPGASFDLDVTSAGRVLARGSVGAEPPPAPSPSRRASEGRASEGDATWQAFARREGPVAIDVALLGGRAAPGFPADIWVRTTDAATHAPVAQATVTVESDGLARAATIAPTDGRGWTRVVATPAGLAVTATLHARAGTREGTWIGGVTMAPGAPAIATRARWSPSEPVTLDVTMPTVRPNAYLAIDDAHGRAWAAAVALEARGDGTSHAAASAPALAPGLYWATASADPGGAEDADGASDRDAWPASTRAIPFFVAPTDEAAMAFGTDAPACVPTADPREAAAALGACLALAAPRPVRRWVALDGFAAQRVLDRQARARGLLVALGALAIAVLLEGTLLVRAGRRGARDAHDRVRQALTVAVALLVGLLGLTLLAAFILRV